MSDLDKLPLYENKATPEEIKIKLNWMYEQLKFIKIQEEDNIPLEHTKIRCGCHKLVNYKYAYRCLYCGVWYCRDCAQEHFGYKVLDNE